MRRCGAAVAGVAAAAVLIFTMCRAPFSGAAAADGPTGSSVAVDGSAGSSAVAVDTESAPWEFFAGMREEIAAQNLELRDELIPAHLSYLEALSLSAAEAEALPPDDELRPLAWARTAYLAETAFRLLDATGEYDAFLRVTEPLRPGAPEEPSRNPAENPAETPEENFTENSSESFAGSSAEVSADASAAFTKSRIAWLRALALERRGKSAEGAAEAAPLGLVRDWLLFASPGAAEDPSGADATADGIAAVLREASALHENAGAAEPASGTGGAPWRAFRSEDPLGRVFPGPLFRDGRSVCALALVRAPADMPAVLLFGADAAATVFVNGAAFAAVRGGADADRESFPVSLRRGWNAVLVRGVFEEDGGAFVLRLATPGGAALGGETVKPSAENIPSLLAEAEAAARSGAPDDAPPAGAPPKISSGAFPDSASGAIAVAAPVDILSRRAAAHPDDARAGFYLAGLLVANRLMEGPERFDREIIFRRAIADSDGDPFFTLMAARAIDSGVKGPDREENLRIVLLRSVADTGSAAALVDLGRLYLDVMAQPRRAKEYADRALAANSMSLRAGLLDYDIAAAMGWEAVAGRLLAELSRRHPEAAPARLRRGRAALASGRHRVALTEFHAVLAVRAGSREALDGAVTSLGMLGQTSAAAELLAGRIAAFPYDASARLRLAELYRALGREDDARRTLRELLAVMPGNPSAAAPLAELDGGLLPGSAPETADAPFAAFRQEPDLTPPAREPGGGWEYLYFQVEDRLGSGGSFDRSVSFAFRVYTRRAARLMRGLSVWVENSFADGTITRLDIVSPGGGRREFTPPARSARGGEELKLFLPVLPPGTAVEVELSLRRGGPAFLGEYFGHIASFAQSAPVRLSRYIFVAPADRRVFFRPVNSAPEAMVVPSADGRTVTRVWEMSDLPAFREEPFSSGQNALSPCVQVSSFADWDEFARWYWRLVGAQYRAPPELKLMARVLGDGGSSPLAKLDRAAEWIAANIGSREWEYGPYAFRPVSARSILSRLSADSKDRTLLLCLLAREYGLEAWPVLAWMRPSAGGAAGGGPGGAGAGGSEGTEEDLPLLNYFNHSLVLVRAGAGGDVLLDAGNPHRPPGVMPPALSGAAGLVVTPEGARRVTVPDAGPSACEWTEEADLVVDADGSVLWEERISADGLAAQILRGRFGGDSAEPDGDSPGWTGFLRSLGADSSAASGEFSAAGEGAGAAGGGVWEGRARLRRFVRMEEGRAALTVPPLPGADEYRLLVGAAAAAPARSQDLLLPHAFRISRTVSVRFPEGWRLVNAEKPIRREYPFGSFFAECVPGADGVLLRVEMEIPGGRALAADYAAFREMAALAERWSAPDLVWERGPWERGQ